VKVSAILKKHDWTALKEESARCIQRRRKRLASAPIKRPRGDESKVKRSFYAVMNSVMGGGSLVRLDDKWHLGMLSSFAGCECHAREERACQRCSVIGSKGAATYIDVIAAVIFAKVQELVASAGAVSLTADGWTDQQMRKYLAVTGHWVDQDWNIHSALLGVVSLSGGDARTVKQHIVEVMARYASVSKRVHVVFFVSDGERAMRSAVALFMQDDSVVGICFAHTVQLCVNDLIRHSDSRMMQDFRYVDVSCLIH
jgi:hypothetical protein